MATPPAPSAEAEDALHLVLREGVREVSDAAEAALWASWMASGDEAVDATMRHGLRFMSSGELEKAIQAFSEVVEELPTFAEGWNKRATAQFLAERFEESIEDCDRVLALKPRHFGCLSGLGICYLRKGEERFAAHWLRKALEVNPRSNDVQRVVYDLEAKSAHTLLRPRIVEVMTELRTNRPPAAPSSPLLSPGPAAPKVRAEWDVRRVEDLDKFTYYFRVSVECLRGASSSSSASSCSGGVSGVARYYALKHAGGSVYPLSRVTQGPAAFSLEPGGVYRYSFMLTLAEELVAARAGLLLRSAEGSELFEASLNELTLRDQPQEAEGDDGGSQEGASPVEVIREVDLSRLNEGYQFMGRLEITIED